MGSRSTSSWTTLGSGGTVSQIGWIVTTSSCEHSVLTTVNEPGCVEKIWANSGLKDDVSPKVQIVLDSADRDRLRLPEVTSSGKGGFKGNLHERRGIRLCSSTITDLFYSKTNKQKEGNARQKGLPRNCELQNTSWRTKKYGQVISPNAFFGVSQVTRWPT